MLTQAMPALQRALAGALPDGAIKALTPALGTCNMPLIHRGPVTIAPPTYPNDQGVERPGRWNPGQYPGLIPPIDAVDGPRPPGDRLIELPGWGSPWNSVYYGGPNFSFPTNSYFNTSIIDLVEVTV